MTFELGSALMGVAAVLTAVGALIHQLREFRREVVSAVERHMELTALNRELLEHIDKQLDETHPHA